MTEEKAVALAYRYLNRRDRTEAELRGYLEGKELPDDEVQAAVGELVQFGYVDDARYARLFAEDKRNLEQWGSDRIRRSLRERGVDRELIEQALAALDTGEESELDRALELLRRRFPQPPADRRERERALGMMIRKGYESELALDALSAYARESAEPAVRQCWRTNTPPPLGATNSNPAVNSRQR